MNREELIYEALKRIKERLEDYFGKSEKEFLNNFDNEDGSSYFVDEYKMIYEALQKRKK